MKFEEIKKYIPEKAYSVLLKRDIHELRPSQVKSIDAGLFVGKNLLVCTPTASGKTLIAELAFMKNILSGKGKALYIVPLKALATEKFKDFSREWGTLINVSMSIGDFDSEDRHLASKDLIIVTVEKLDSLIRHKASWLNDVHTVIIDEAHLLGDTSRGPTLEIVLTILMDLLKDYQLIALSATVGNPETVASWLNAELVLDNWRPVELKKGIYFNGNLEFY